MHLASLALNGFGAAPCVLLDFDVNFVCFISFDLERGGANAVPKMARRRYDLGRRRRRSFVTRIFSTVTRFYGVTLLSDGTGGR